MKIRTIVNLISAATFSVSTLSACGSTDTALFGTTDKVVFSVLDEGQAASAAKNPELVAELNALKDLSPEERKAKMEELKAKYPELANKKAHGMPSKGKFHGGRKGGMGMGFGNIAKDNPELAGELETLRKEHQEKVKETIAKYPEVQKKIEEMKQNRESRLEDKNPELAAELKALKDLSPEERKAKMEELKAKYPQMASKKAPSKFGKHKAPKPTQSEN